METAGAGSEGAGEDAGGGVAFKVITVTGPDLTSVMKLRAPPSSCTRASSGKGRGLAFS